MNNKVYFKSERFNSDLFYVSIGLYITATISPGCFGGTTPPFLGCLFLLVGILALFDKYDWMIGVFWLASPLLFFAWHYRRHAGIAVICSFSSLVCWLSFFFSIGIDGFFNLYLPYCFGLLSITIMFFNSIRKQLEVYGN